MQSSADQPVAYENKECQVLFWRKRVFKIIQVHSHVLALLMLTHNGVLENHAAKKKVDITALGVIDETKQYF